MSDNYNTVNPRSSKKSWEGSETTFVGNKKKAINEIARLMTDTYGRNVYTRFNANTCRAELHNGDGEVLLSIKLSGEQITHELTRGQVFFEQQQINTAELQAHIKRELNVPVDFKTHSA